ncbi:MAG: hypothetical protein BVN34_03870 [Proteobacteria bacterium ST_bin12]|nr:MAG: hypothetical protein BVN34_03870 [Proteobacteria bacterium ST_bin12]
MTGTRFTNLNNTISIVKNPYFFAFLIFLVAICIRLIIFPVNPYQVYLIFFPAIITSFYFCGFNAGATTLQMCATSAYYIFNPPFWSFKYSFEAVFGLLFFSASGLLIGKIIENLRLNEQRYLALLNNQTDLVSRFKADGTILFINSAYSDFFGVNHRTLVGKRWHPIAHPDDLEMINEKINGITHKNLTVIIENRVFDKNNEIRWVQFINHGILDSNSKIVEYQSVGRDITDIRLEQNRITHLAHHDPLTGLPNRLLLDDRLLQAISFAKRTLGKVRVYCFDLDKFKPINDKFGHAAGDEVLQELSQRMKSVIRESDTICRLGGDEFILIVSDKEFDTTQANIAERVIEQISRPVKLTNGNVVFVTATFGFSEYPIDSNIPCELIKIADNRMLQLKHSL